MMKKITLKTGLFEDSDLIIEAADAPVIDLSELQDDEDWDHVVYQILNCDLVISA